MSQDFKALVEASLFLASAISFDFSFTPPNGPPKSLPPWPSLRAGFTPAMREWILVFLTKYALPIEITMYYLVSLNEILNIISLAFPSLSIQPVFPLLSNRGPGIPPTVLLGCLLSTAGCVLRIFCYRALAESFTFELVPSGKLSSNPELVKSPKLVTNGPYSVVRHPAYAGTWMTFIGSAMVHEWLLGTGVKALGYAWLTGVGSGITVLLMRMDDEDALMKQQFKSQWETWNKVVRYRLIPGVY